MKQKMATDASLEERKAMLERLKDLAALVVRLHQDHIESGEALDPSRPSSARDWVRGTFSLIDGCTSAIAALLLDARSVLGGHIDDRERAPLEGRGKPSAKDRIKTCLKVAQLLFACDSFVDFAAVEWSTFCGTYATRTRLTHPSARGHLEVGEDDLLRVEAARDFFRRTAHSVFTVATEKLAEAFGLPPPTIPSLSGPDDAKVLFERVAKATEREW